MTDMINSNVCLQKVRVYWRSCYKYRERSLSSRINLRTLVVRSPNNAESDRNTTEPPSTATNAIAGRLDAAAAAAAANADAQRLLCSGRVDAASYSQQCCLRYDNDYIYVVRVMDLWVNTEVHVRVYNHETAYCVQRDLRESTRLTNINEHWLKETSSEIARVGGHYAVQGHSRSLILIPVENQYATSC